jgi:hypothetical protein
VYQATKETHEVEKHGAPPKLEPGRIDPETGMLMCGIHGCQELFKDKAKMQHHQENTGPLVTKHHAALLFVSSPLSCI